MKQWIQDNKAFVTMLIASTVIVGAILVAQGCDLRKAVDLDVPPQVAASIDPQNLTEPIDYTYADADRVAEEWKRFVDTATKQLEASLNDAAERHSMLVSLVDMGVVTVNEIAPTLPGGAFLVGGLSLITGIFLKRPGEDKRVMKEKEDSYNAGLKKAKQLLVEAAKDESKEVSSS
jgi:hypothetical protein